MTKHIGMASSLLVALLAFAAPAHAQKYVAAAVSADGKTVATASSDAKKSVQDLALQNCAKKSGQQCGYYYWTRSTSHMIMLYCTFELQNETISGGLGGHSKKSLADAQKKAFREAQSALNRGGYRLKTEDCAVKATYSDGAFNTY